MWLPLLVLFVVFCRCCSSRIFFDVIGVVVEMLFVFVVAVVVVAFVVVN